MDTSNSSMTQNDQEVKEVDYLRAIQETIQRQPRQMYVARTVEGLALSEETETDASNRNPHS
jgi:hypothetical protein